MTEDNGPDGFYCGIPYWLSPPGYVPDIKLLTPAEEFRMVAETAAIVMRANGGGVND